MRPHLNNTRLENRTPRLAHDAVGNHPTVSQSCENQTQTAEENVAAAAGKREFAALSRPHTFPTNRDCESSDDSSTHPMGFSATRSLRRLNDGMLKSIAALKWYAKQSCVAHPEMHVGGVGEISRSRSKVPYLLLTAVCIESPATKRKTGMTGSSSRYLHLQKESERINHFYTRCLNVQTSTSCVNLHSSFIPSFFLPVPALNSHCRDPILRMWVLMFVILVLGPSVILVTPFLRPSDLMQLLLPNSSDSCPTITVSKL
jgi:hypothetical protein